MLIDVWSFPGRPERWTLVTPGNLPVIILERLAWGAIINSLEPTCKYVKVGGTLIYSTCTIQDSENIDVVNEFLQKNKNFELVPIKEVNVDLENQEKGYMKIYPNVHDMDGFFISKLIRVR